MQAYAKFCNVPVYVKATNNPFKSPNGQLPVLKFKGITYSSVDQILDVFQQHKYTIDNEITRLQMAESCAFATMIEESMKPAIQHLLFVLIHTIKLV